MVIAEHCLDAELTPLLAYLAGNEVTSSAYLRLVTVPVEVPFSLPEAYIPRRGRGWTVREGADLLVFGAGPVALSGLYRASQVLAAEHGLDVSLIAMPWLNEVDEEWFRGVLEGHTHVVTVENHLVVGGLGASVRAALDSFPGHQFTSIGLTSFPVCGQNDEVLAHHGLDAHSLADALLSLHKGPQ